MAPMVGKSTIETDQYQSADGFITRFHVVALVYSVTGDGPI